MINDDLLTKTATTWGIALSHTQVQQFATYAAELQAWNKRFNLTSANTLADITTRHFLDSLRCVPSWGAIPHTLADVGSGAGFPGLPLKIAFPTLHLTLIEATQKKVGFLQHIVSVLALDYVTVIHARVETIGHAPQQRECYDVVTARAIAALSTLAEYCLPLTRIGGRFLAPKGSNATDEIAQAHHAISLLGGKVATVESVTLPGLEPRTLVVVEKVATTPDSYPRAVGVPARRPLLLRNGTNGVG